MGYAFLRWPGGIRIPASPQPIEMVSIKPSMISAFHSGSTKCSRWITELHLLALQAFGHEDSLQGVVEHPGQAGMQSTIEWHIQRAIPYGVCSNLSGNNDKSMGFPGDFSRGREQSRAEKTTEPGQDDPDPFPDIVAL